MIFKYIREPTLGNLFPCRDAFKYLERGMKCVGWLPPKRGTRFYWPYLVWMVWIHISAEIYLPTVFIAGYVINFKTYTPGAFLSSVQAFFNVLTLIYKIAVIFTNMWRFERVKKLLDIMDKRCVTFEERIEIHRCVARCNWVYLLYQIAYSAYSILTSLTSAFRGYTAWTSYNPFVDYRKSKRNLWIAATFEYFVASGAVYADQMCDVYPLIFGLVLRTQIQLLSRRVQKLRTHPEKTDAENYQDLVNCVKDHKLVREYCDLFRPVISRTFFAQLLVIGLGLGLSFVNLLFFSKFWTGVATFIFIIVLILQTFPFCYVCELIKDDCYNLTLAIFYSNYYDAGRRYNSTLIYFLHQSQKSINFIAGGIFPICMRTNIDFAKFAFSVVTVVKQMNLVEKLKRLDL